MGLIEFIHNLVHFCLGSCGFPAVSSPGRWSSKQQTGGLHNRQKAIHFTKTHTVRYHYSVLGNKLNTLKQGWQNLTNEIQNEYY